MLTFIQGFSVQCGAVVFPVMEVGAITGYIAPSGRGDVAEAAGAM
ncbi:hypothetical protein [Viscerimonas tarda]